MISHVANIKILITIPLKTPVIPGAGWGGRKSERGMTENIEEIPRSLHPLHGPALGMTLKKVQLL